MINDLLIHKIDEFVEVYGNTELTTFGILVTFFIIIPLLLLTFVLDVLLFPIEIIIFLLKKSRRLI